MYQSSALTPSGTRSSTPAASAAPAVVIRSTPSAPSPRRRSHNAATTAGVSVSAASKSASTTKSFWVPWPFAKITRSGYVPPSPQRGVGVTGGGGVEPVDPVVAAKPGPLPSQKAPRADERRLPGGGAVTSRVEVGENLGVAQRPCRGDAVAQAAVEQRDQLVDQSLSEHRLGPPAQSLVEKLCVAI